MITEDRVKEIIPQRVKDIRSKYDAEKVILYGSFAYGVPEENSGIDLLVIKESSERPLDRRVRVRRIVDIRDSSYPAFCLLCSHLMKPNRGWRLAISLSRKSLPGEKSYMPDDKESPYPKDWIWKGKYESVS